MDKGFVVMNGIIFFALAAYVFWAVVFPIILDVIWIKRVKRGKSKIIGPLGIISIIVTIMGLLNLPDLFTMIGECFGWK